MYWWEQVFHTTMTNRNCNLFGKFHFALAHVHRDITIAFWNRCLKL